MPKKLERKLKRECKKKGLSKKRCNAYVYGNKTMQAWLRKKRLKKKK